MVFEGFMLLLTFLSPRYYISNMVLSIVELAVAARALDCVQRYILQSPLGYITIPLNRLPSISYVPTSNSQLLLRGSQITLGTPFDYLT